MEEKEYRKRRKNTKYREGYALRYSVNRCIFFIMQIKMVMIKHFAFESEILSPYKKLTFKMGKFDILTYIHQSGPVKKKKSLWSS